MLPHRHVPDFAATTEARARRDRACSTGGSCARLDRLYDTPTPYIAAWHQAPVHAGRADIRLMLQVTSPRRAADKLKYRPARRPAWAPSSATSSPRPSAARLRAGRPTAWTERHRSAGPGTPTDGPSVSERNGQPTRTPSPTPSADSPTRYGRAPRGVWSAPGRANLIGEHTDYNDGFVLPFAIAERTAVAAARRDDGVITVASHVRAGERQRRLADIAPGGGDGWAGVPARRRVGARPQARDAAGPGGADLFIDSDVPTGAGLSSSAALEMRGGAARSPTCGARRSSRDRARQGRPARGERGRRRADRGHGPVRVAARPAGRGRVPRLPQPARRRSVPLRLAPAGLALVLTDTGERHAHAAGGYAARRASCERAARMLGVPALRDVGVADLPRRRGGARRRDVPAGQARGDRGRAGAGDGRRPGGGRPVGPAAARCSPRRTPRCATTTRSPPPPSTWPSRWRCRAGALGARMTGGGFGGSAITLIEATGCPRCGRRRRTRSPPAGLGRPPVRAVRSASEGAPSGVLSQAGRRHHPR